MNSSRLRVGGKEDVGGLEVAMNHLVVVQIAQARGDLPHNKFGKSFWKFVVASACKPLEVSQVAIFKNKNGAVADWMLKEKGEDGKPAECKRK